MKKKILLIVIPLILIILSIVGYFLYQDYRVKHAVKKVVLKTNEVEVFDKVHLSDVIGSINGKLVKDKEIDTTKIGKKKITFEFVNDDDIKVDYTIKINIVDKTPPVIKSITRYGIEVGNKDFYKKFFCGDNYDNKPKCSIEGKYDVDTPGEYETTNSMVVILDDKPIVYFTGCPNPCESQYIKYVFGNNLIYPIVDEKNQEDCRFWKDKTYKINL